MHGGPQFGFRLGCSGHRRRWLRIGPSNGGEGRRAVIIFLKDLVADSNAECQQIMDSAGEERQSDLSGIAARRAKITLTRRLRTFVPVARSTDPSTSWIENGTSHRRK